MVESTLSKFGFTDFEYISLNRLSPDARLRAIIPQLESHVLHSQEDLPVSMQYPYYFGTNGRLYTDTSCDEKYCLDNHVDKKERGGYYLEGIYKTMLLAWQNKGKLVLLYSPPGIVDFDDDESSPYYQKRYRGGQLYLNYSDGAKINALAISVSGKGEEWAKFFMDDVAKEAEIQDEKEKIAMYLQQPVITNYSLYDFVRINQSIFNDSTLVYTNNKDKQFTLKEVIDLIHASIAGKLKPSIPVITDEVKTILSKPEIDARDVQRIYLGTLRNFLISQGMDTFTFGGFCNGSSTSLNEIEQILQGTIPGMNVVINLYSSASRAIFQGLESANSDEKGPLTFVCDVCGEKHTRHRHEIMKVCPTKGTEMKKC